MFLLWRLGGGQNPGFFISWLLWHKVGHELTNRSMTHFHVPRGDRLSPELDRDLGWPWMSYRRECLINLNKYHYLVCGCIVFHCGRTDRRTDIFTGFIMSSLRRWPKTVKRVQSAQQLDSKHIVHIQCLRQMPFLAVIVCVFLFLAYLF